MNRYFYIVKKLPIPDNSLIVAIKVDVSPISIIHTHHSHSSYGSHLLQPFLLSALLFLFVLPNNSLAEISSKPKALVLQVTKDPSTLQYLTRINTRTPLVPVKLTLDLGGQYPWVDCENGYLSSSYKPVPCDSAQCKLARAKSCVTECFSSPKPGCNNNTCALLPDNSITRTGTSGEVAQDVVSIQSTDGSNPGQLVWLPNLIFTCGATFLLEGLANGVKGMAGLGRSDISLPSQFSSFFRFERKFAICLSSSNGVVFFGKGPYVLLPNVDVSISLIYTPLILNPVSTAASSFEGDASSDYFIGVTSININDKPVQLNASLLTINKEDGTGGTKISTVHPYTVMERSIYKSFTKAYTTALANVPIVKPVAPFGYCFNSTFIAVTRVGLAVPTVDLVLQDSSVVWRMTGANSVVSVKKDVVCLGFVDGGVNPRTSIVIGGHQLEDNLLQFDLANKRVGFSSSLLFRRTTCANFNFTSNAPKGVMNLFGA